ncbi:hypothetical protein L1049_001416 [Liquidambar formosana]|uniref:SWIM-type domain-containing protein n=1 Tax=Liquidambar formosana TaxID=63359 RepID=A0AAP0R666_LIQFO
MVHDETRAVGVDEVDGVDEAYGMDGVAEVDEWMEDSDESGSDSEISVRSERILFGDPDEDNLTDSEGIHNEDVEALIDVAIKQRDVGGGAANVVGARDVGEGATNVVGAGEVGGGERGSVKNMGWISFPECDVESDYVPSDELVSLLSDSDDDILIKRDVLYNRDRDLENPKLILGMKFGKPFIGLDGCFLKGCYGGQLLSAVGRDGNNQMFLVAIAVVEVETKETWNWFMRNLLQAIDCHDYKTVTFISDRQKGLVDTFEVMMPGADHRYYLRHMYSNFREKHKGQDLKDLMWKAASCYTVHEFETHMEAIKKVSVGTYNWLLTNHPSVWSRSHFSPRSKCDMLCNNPSESWNKYILEAREKPIITMLEMIRRQLMNRFQVRKQEMEKWEGPLCPKIQEKFDRVKEDARHCEVIYAGDGIYEIEYKGQTTFVNLGARTCMCRKWEVTGIPCSHAVAVILRASMNPKDFVDECYHKVTNSMAYAPMIYLIGDPTNWAASGCKPVGPPPYKKAPGRPKKARKKEVVGMVVMLQEEVEVKELEGVLEVEEEVVETLKLLMIKTAIFAFFDAIGLVTLNTFGARA